MSPFDHRHLPAHRSQHSGTPHFSHSPIFSTAVHRLCYQTTKHRRKMFNPRSGHHPAFARASQPSQYSSQGISIHLRGSKHIIQPDYGTDISRFEACAPDYKRSIQLSVGREMRYLVVDKLVSTRASCDSSIRMAELLLGAPTLLRILHHHTSQILDLDGGYGFCGIACMRLGFAYVVFVDSNMSAIKEVVWPNIVMNCGENVSGARCLVSNNWIALSEFLSDPGENKYEFAFVCSHLLIYK